MEPYADQPYYVGFRVGDQEIGLDPSGHSKGLQGPIAYWRVGDIREMLQALVAAGAALEQDVRDVGDGRLIASVRDADANIIGLMQQT